jgi:hypothetical protein
MVVGAPSRSERQICGHDRWRATGGESSAAVGVRGGGRAAADRSKARRRARAGGLGVAAARLSHEGSGARGALWEQRG